MIKTWITIDKSWFCVVYPHLIDFAKFYDKIVIVRTTMKHLRKESEERSKEEQETRWDQTSQTKLT